MLSGRITQNRVPCDCFAVKVYSVQATIKRLTLQVVMTFSVKTTIACNLKARKFAVLDGCDRTAKTGSPRHILHAKHTVRTKLQTPKFPAPWEVSLVDCTASYPDHFVYTTTLHHAHLHVLHNTLSCTCPAAQLYSYMYRRHKIDSIIICAHACLCM